jgi:hypothetical protein
MAQIGWPTNNQSTKWTAADADGLRELVDGSVTSTGRLGQHICTPVGPSKYLEKAQLTKLHGFDAESSVP